MKEHFDLLQKLIDAAVMKGLFGDANSVIEVQSALQKIRKHCESLPNENTER